jgi:hypothetical protein
VKEKLNLLPSIGLIIYIIVSLLDKFIIEINDYIYITIMVIAIVIIVIGGILNRKNLK